MTGNEAAAGLEGVGREEVVEVSVAVSVVAEPCNCGFRIADCGLKEASVVALKELNRPLTCPSGTLSPDGGEGVNPNCFSLSSSVWERPSEGRVRGLFEFFLPSAWRGVLGNA